MQTIKLKAFKNGYCDAIGLALSEFVDIYDLADKGDIESFLNEEEIDCICEYAVLKNKIAGVGELYLKVAKPGFIGKYFDKYNIDGKEILSARLIDCLSTRDFVGGRLMIEVESLLEYNEDYLSKIVDFCATTDTPVLIKMGQSLEEVGKIVNKFNMSPAEVLEDYGFLDRECYLYGMNFIDKEDQKLLTKYASSLILSPRDDAEEGRGFVNLYNLIFNGLKFAFSSGNCYNIDMFAEAKLAICNTNNLMFERNLIEFDDIISSLQSNFGDFELKLEDECKKETLFDQRVCIMDEKLMTRYSEVREKIKQIAKKLKEKI